MDVPEASSYLFDCSKPISSFDITGKFRSDALFPSKSYRLVPSISESSAIEAGKALFALDCRILSAFSTIWSKYRLPDSRIAEIRSIEVLSESSAYES